MDYAVEVIHTHVGTSDMARQSRHAPIWRLAWFGFASLVVMLATSIVLALSISLANASRGLPADVVPLPGPMPQPVEAHLTGD